MRLRYLRVQNVPPLNDVSLRFQQERMLNRAYAIHFVAGVNGSGKTRLLRAITEVFLSLEKRRLPSFPVTIAYELGPSIETDTTNLENRRLCYLNHPGHGESEARLVIFNPTELVNRHNLDEVNWDQLPELIGADDSWSPAILKYASFSEIGSGSDLDYFLPSALLVYTSGVTEPWEPLFDPIETSTEALNIELDVEQERPPGWDRIRESLYVAELSGFTDKQRVSPSIGTTGTLGTLLAGDEDLRTTHWGVFLSSNRLHLATWSLALKQFSLRAGVSQQTEIITDDTHFTSLLSQIGWLSTVTLGIRLNLDSAILDNLLRGQRESLLRLYQVATFIRSDPTPGTGRLLVFDLTKPLEISPDSSLLGFGEGSTAAALLWAFSGESTTALDVFRTLYYWQQIGLVAGVTLTLKKQDVDGLVSYDDLSDGERMYVSRMAVLHLARDEDDALIILDEPETHFNDAWKREIVDVIDGAMQRRTNEILISVHSSIALTDAFNEEIELLRKVNGEISNIPIAMPTFGADPSEIMTKVFEAPDSIGQRALEYLETLLARAWSQEDRATLEYLIQRTGAGFYRSELRTIWRRLTGDVVRDSPTER